MSSGPTTWPIDGPPVAPSITFTDLPTSTMPTLPQGPTMPVFPVQAQQPKTTLEAQLAAIAQRPVTP